MTGSLTGPGEPFSVIDELTCYHDHPAEPSNVHLEARLAGHLDPASLRAATAAALSAEPRARARRIPARGLSRRYAWEFPAQPDRDPVSLATWGDERDLAGVRTAFMARAPTLDGSPPLRLLLAAGPGEDCVILNAHHAALDGHSCLELLRRIAREYPAGDDSGRARRSAATRARVAGSAPAPNGQAEESAAGWRDGEHAPSGVAPGAGCPGEPGAGRRWRRPRLIARFAADRGTGERNGYGYHLLPVTDVARLRDLGSSLPATVNDVLICALIVSIARWNAAHGRPAGRIRITMPLDARPAGEKTRLGNVSRLAVITARWPGQDADLGRLADEVIAQTRAAKNHGGPEASAVSRALTTGLLPVVVKRRLLRIALASIGPAVVDTSLLTNLGRVAEPLRFGSLAVTRIAFSTSAHMPRGLSVGAITVGEHLQLCLRYRLALLDDSGAARFARCYAAALDELALAAAHDPRPGRA